MSDEYIALPSRLPSTPMSFAFRLPGATALFAVVTLVLTLLASPAGAGGSDSLLSTSFRGHGAIMLFIEPQSGAIVDANAAAATFYGHSIADLKGMRIQDFNALDPDEVAAERAQALAESRNYFVFPHHAADGRIRTVEVYSSPVRLSDGRDVLLSVIHDVSGKTLAEGELLDYKGRLEELVDRRTRELNASHARQRRILWGGVALQALVIGLLAFSIRHCRRAERALRRERERLRLAANVFEHAHEGICVTDAQERIVDVNPTLIQMTGYSREELLGQTPRMLRSGQHKREFFAAMWAAIGQHGYWRGQVWNRRKNGEAYPELLTISAVPDSNGKPAHYVGVFTDITHIKRYEERLEHIAHYDALTDIPNRVLLADRMQQAIAQTRRAGHLMAVCYLDLDGFKPVNDVHGHAVGDSVLVEMAARLKAVLRGGDTVARLGGDEFALLLVGLEHIDECEQALERLLAAIARPVMVGGQAAVISASIGVTLFPHDQSSPDTLLRHADQAMYEAKQAGRNRYHIFDAENDRRAQARHEKLSRIGQAISARELVLHYQPKVDMRAGRVVGAEALVRWQHPERGLLAPVEFLPLIEGHELIVRLGEWVIDAALEQMASWRAHGLDLAVSVNIAARHLQQPDFVRRLKEILARHPHVPVERLELEVLETAALEDMERASQVIEECRAFGVHFALDDFGTGYSSLTYFKRLPVSVLKIDQSFVRDMLTDQEDRAIVEGVIGLTRVFQRIVIAEGVETVAHGVALIRMGCALGQGYGIARPMGAADLPAWVRAWRPDPAWAAAGREANVETIG